MLDTRPRPAPARRRPFGVEILAVGLLAAILARGPIGRAFASPRAQEWVTVFVAIVVQAMPFVVLGTLLSAAIATLVPERFFARALPSRPALAVPVAGLAGLALPGCECASVPVAGALVRRGVTPAAALAFLLAAPAINPVVLAATAVAFPGQPLMVVGRLVASLATSVAMGWLWLRLGRDDWLRVPRRAPQAGSRAMAYFAAVRQDAAEAAGFLVIGAATAACLNVLVPQRWLHVVAAHHVVAVVALAGLAVLLSICSEADAFVAASLSQFSLTARLAFLVVGPMVDLKLFAMQAGTFGRRFAVRFAPATFVVGVGLAVAVGGVLL
ncbi:permease [Dactylosporangium sp. CA-092794]|uniref:permease n=1 Tax=Dactylosporangium sp. CA-092794 TaxID=3239929 RepID=UPI003D8ABD00